MVRPVSTVDGEMTGLTPEKVRAVPVNVSVLMVPSTTRLPFAERSPSLSIVTPLDPYPPPKVVLAVDAIFNVPAVVVISPPFTATSPDVVMFPVAPAIDQYVPERSFSPVERAVTISASERSIPVVIPPAADCILRPVERA